MRTLICYASSSGTTQSCAEKLMLLLDGDAQLCRLGTDKLPPLDDYDKIIIGGSIHIGRIQKPVRKMIIDNIDQLMEKPVGLFICCLAEDQEVENELAAAFPEMLREHAVVTASFGGCFIPARVNFIQRKAMEMMLKRMPDDQDFQPGENIDRLDENALNSFAERMNLSK